jgi:hypothetical protein
MEDNYIIKHIGDGNFEVDLDGEIMGAGKSLCGMIRYTYFEDYTIPPDGWTTTRKQLLEDYHPKMMKDVMSGKLKPGKMNSMMVYEEAWL